MDKIKGNRLKLQHGILKFGSFANGSLLTSPRKVTADCRRVSRNTDFITDLWFLHPQSEFRLVNAKLLEYSHINSHVI